MTPSDFMNRYRDYRTREESVAVAERDKVNAEGIEDDTAVAVAFSGWWCLMLTSAYDFTVEIGVSSTKAP